MSSYLKAATAAGLFVLSLGAATASQAANEDFCRDYARAAERQVHKAIDSGSCGWAIDRNPARWTTDYHAHFDWCLGASYDDANRERNARRAVLEHCASDWR